MTEKIDTVEQRISDRLRAAFTPHRMEVINESHMHAGHQEKFDGSGETHFRVRIVSDAFAGMSRLQRHRAVNDLLKDKLSGGVHALALELAAPEEPVRW
jgi:BolA family transcriptional regulator, general stress-responsive regulator